MSSLFRPEVFAARREAWLGEAQIVQPLPITLISLASVLFVAVIAFYTLVGHYTRRVHATGILAPKSGLIQVASPVSGRVITSSAVDGLPVEKGDLLYTIDVDAVSASGPTEKSVLVQLRAQSGSVERQRQNRQLVAQVEREALRDQLANMLAQDVELKKEIALQQEMADSLKQRADQLKAALANGRVIASEFQTQNYLYIQANSQLAQFEQSHLQAEGKIADLRAKIAAFDPNLAREIAEMDRQIAQLKQQIAESEAKHAIEIRAPERGILTALSAHIGQQVAAGGTMLTLLPVVGNLQANLYVDSSAIGFVAQGEVVMLRYSAFPFQRFGLYRGTVTEVTRAPVGAGDNPNDDRGTPEASKPQKGLYRIRVKPDVDYVRTYGTQRPLQAGMQVDADISLEKRTLFSWLLDPAYHLKRSATLVSGSLTP